MGNLCSSPSANTITLRQWLVKIYTPQITTQLASWKTTSSCLAKDVVSGKEYYIYHVRKGDFEDITEPGHVCYTADLHANLIMRFFKLCQKRLSTSHINDAMFEYASLVLCVRESIPNMIDHVDITDDEILGNIIGFSLCNVSSEKQTGVSNDNDKNVLEIDTVCSNCKQGTKIMTTLMQLPAPQQSALFGNTYTKVALTALESAATFYEKLGFSTISRSEDTDTRVMMKDLMSGGNIYTTRNGRRYKVHTGVRGGSYIVVKGKKVYV
jgi:hypothetical protein